MLCSIQDLSSQIRLKPKPRAQKLEESTSEPPVKFLESFFLKILLSVTLGKLFELFLSNSRVER